VAVLGDFGHRASLPRRRLRAIRLPRQRPWKGDFAISR